MATIKKGLKKAQNGDKKVKFNRSIGSTYEATKNPNSNFKIKTIDKGVNEVRNFDTDTTGYSAGKKEFMGKLTRSPLKGSGKTKTQYFTADRATIKDAIDKGYNKKTNIAMKTGGSTKKKMKNGGSLSALSASTKRDKGTDVGGAWTKVQNRTLAGARGKATLTKDKQLGATKMAKRGMKISKKK
jgi:hypothetical protein